MTARLSKTRNNSKKSLRLKRVTALLIAAGCIVGPALAQNVIIGDTGFESLDAPLDITGTFSTLILGNTATGVGVLNFSSGPITISTGLTDQLIVGNNGQGTVNMTGGVLSVLNGDVGTNAFVVGNNAGSIGVFNQSGGLVDAGRSLTIAQNGGTGTYNLLTGIDPTLTAQIITVGFNGTGTFNQENGTAAIANSLFIGTDNGTYNLSGGSLSVLGGQGTIVGTVNVGNFNQSGGTHLTENLIIGNTSAARGTYEMSGGTLTVVNQMLVGKGDNSFDLGTAGTFRQTGGDVTASVIKIGGEFDNLALQSSFGRGRYELVAGTVTAQRTEVGWQSQGTVLQTGGTFNAGFLRIGGAGLFAFDAGNGNELYSNGVYNLQGGQLNTTLTQVAVFGLGTFNHSGTGAHNVNGDLIVGNQPAFIEPVTGTVEQGVYNFSGGTLTVTGNTTLGAGNNDAPGLPGGIGTFNQSGGVATLNNIILGGTGTEAGGTGIVNLSAGQMIVNGGLTLADGAGSTGTFNLTGSGVLNVSGDSVIGRGGVGVFTQNGSDTVHTVGGILYLGGSGTGGETAGTIGTYNLMSGQLQTALTWIGQAVVGVFNQSGGTHTTGDILLGNCGGCLGGNSSGTYNLVGGTLTAGSITVSAFGRGEFNQSGGIATVTSNLTVGSGPATGGTPTREGIVNLSGGSLTVSGLTTIGAGNNDFVGEPGAKGTFNQTGGVATLNNFVVGGAGTEAGGTGIVNISAGQMIVHGTMTLAKGAGSSGTFNLSGTGVLTVSIDSVVGLNGIGVFTQSNATSVHSVAGELALGVNGGSSGTYTLTNGTVTANLLSIGGSTDLQTSINGGTGVFTQNGGAVTVGGMGIGQFGGNGRYDLNGGTLNVTGTAYVSGNSIGNFNQTGGTFTADFLNVGILAGGTGIYTMTGGTLHTTGSLGVGGPSAQGTFTQSGLTAVQVDSSLFVNNDGTSTTTGGSYAISGGTLSVTGNAYIGNSSGGTPGTGGLFNQTGGVVTLNSQLIIGNIGGDNGTYNMSSGTLTVSANSYIGDAGKGTMNLTGNAAVTVTGNTYIGNNGTGANTGTLTIANNSSYTSAGAVPGGITLGQNAGSSGSIVISDAGTLSTNNRLTVGAAGTGSVLQSGTSIVTAGGLRVGESGPGSSAYTMNGGTLNVLNTAGVEGGTRIGLAGTGTFNLNTGTHNTTFMEIGGTNFAQGSGGTGVYNLNGGALVASGTISINPQGGSSGTLNVAGGALTAPLIINKDKLNYSGGSITANINNTANVNVSGGAPRTLTGSLSNNTGGVLTVAAATPFTVSGVLTNAAGASIVAGANITVGQDYNNLASLSGNAYDRRANVTGAGQILAAGAGAATAQTLSGNVTGANAAGATMNFGNVRVGQSSTQNYAIGNINTGGPDLRGAIQTTVNGANLTDARLSGAGVTAGTWGAVAAGGTNGGLGVTFTASSAGALTNQKIAIVNNFENTNSQVLTITGAAFNTAIGNATPTPATVANQRVGGTNTTALTVTNQAAAGAFSEDLRASFTGSSGTAAFSGGPINALVAGTSDNSAMGVRVDTTSAGAKNGTVTLTYQTTGTVNGVSNGLGLAAANGPQVINVSGNVYQIAQPSPGSLPTTVNLGNFRAGAGAQSSAINITNTNVGAPVGFQEGLAANVGVTTGGATGTGFANAVVGTSGALQVGLSGIAAGVNSGTVQVQLQSNGITTTGSNGLTAFNLGGPQAVTVTGTGFNAAVGNTTPSPVVVANQRIGANLTAALTVTNQAAPGAFSEDLRASFSGSSGAAVTVGGPINALLAGANDNSTMSVRVDASSAGAKSGSVTLAYQTTGTVNGVSNGLGLAAANGPQVVNVSGNVYQVANPAPGALPTTVNLGNFRAGAGAQSQTISITNTNIAPTVFQEGLAASIVTTTGPATGTGFTNAQAGASGALQVGLSGIAAGVNNGSVQVQLQSNGITTTGSNGLGSLNLGGAQTVTVTGTGYRLAQANSIGAVNFGNIHVGDVASQALSITNMAAADGFSEKLNASFGTTTDARILTNGGSVNQLAAGQTNNTGMVVSLNTAAAGVVSGTARVNLVSDGTGTSGLGLTNLPGQDVGVSGTITAVGNVYRLANPVIDTAQPVAFGNVRVGASASQVLSITNNVPNDGFSEKLNAQSGATTGGVTTSGTFALLGASATDNTNVRVGINTATAGLKNGTATINFQSDGTGTSGLGITNLASQNVTVTGAVYNTAVGNSAPNGTIALGNFRVGQPGGGTPQSQGIAISNTVAGPFTESLGVASASVNNAAFNLTNAIGGNLVAAGATTSNALNIARTGGSAGVNTGTIAIQYTTDGTGTSGLAAINSNAQNITVNATGYNAAVGNAAPNGPITLGSFRVGQPGGAAPQNQGIAITNTVAGPFTEGLGVASASVNNAAFNLTNAIGGNLVAAGATTSNALNIARTGGSAGVNTGTIAIQYTTDGAGTSGLAAVNSNAQNITVNATGYTTAVATVQPATVNFGIVHVGQVVAAQGVSVQNTALITAANDTLNVSIGGTSGPFSNNGGSVTGLAAGAAANNTALTVGLNTTTAGVFSGNATVSLASHNPDMADLTLVAQSVALSGQVNNYANGALRKNSGVGGFNAAGRVYTLDLGTLFHNTGLQGANLGALNDVLGPSDLLDGSFELMDAIDFGVSGFNPFANLGAGQSVDNLLVNLSTANLGSFQDTYLVHLLGHNASGFSEALGDLTLILRGNVIDFNGTVPEPDSLLLMLIALAGLGATRRRKPE
jgi:hypothetical protein